MKLSNKKQVRDYGWKMQAMRSSPYDYSLLLDADTYVCAHSLSDMWQVSAQFVYACIYVFLETCLQSVIMHCCWMLVPESVLIIQCVRTH